MKNRPSPWSRSKKKVEQKNKVENKNSTAGTHTKRMEHLYLQKNRQGRRIDWTSSNSSVPPEKKFLKNCFMLGCVDKSSEKKSIVKTTPLALSFQSPPEWGDAQSFGFVPFLGSSNLIPNPIPAPSVERDPETGLPWSSDVDRCFNEDNACCSSSLDLAADLSEVKGSCRQFCLTKSELFLFSRRFFF
jgi:hypothetical protein